MKKILKVARALLTRMLPAYLRETALDDYQEIYQTIKAACSNPSDTLKYE